MRLGHLDPRIVELDALAPGAAHEYFVRRDELFDVGVGHSLSTADLTTARPPGEGRSAFYLKMLTERAATSRMLSAETADSESISIFALRVSGSASVGLNAIELVNDT